MIQLKIDPEFRDKIPPLTESEFKQLEENIVRDGEVREPIVTWNNTIIDGHHRWRIIQTHPEIQYHTKKMEFADKWAAIVWMCQNQLGKRNLTDAQKTYLIGKEYEAMKKSVGNSSSNRSEKGMFVQCDQSGSIGSMPKKTKEIIAEKHGIGSTSVQRAEEFTSGLDAAETVSPGFKESVLTGTVKAPKAVIARIAKMDEPKQKKTIEAIQKGERVHVPPSAPKEPEPPHTSEYTYDDLKVELDCVVGVFERNFKSTLVVHSTMIADEKGKEKVIAALSEAEAAIKKLKELVL